MQTPCRRCLLKDMTENDYYESVLHYRARLPHGQRTPDDLYAQRLAACKQCEALENGVCMQCGCYVEMRAAARKNHCPLGEAHW